MIGIAVYIVVLSFTFFAGSFMVARHGHEDPTEPSNFFTLVGASLMWPITIPLVAAILLLLGMAKLAERLSGGTK